MPLLYIVHRYFAGQALQLNPYDLILFMSGAFLVATIFEAVLGYAHTAFFGWRLWEYRVFPNHGGYGSFLGPLYWPWYGFHLYLFHQVLALRQQRLANTTFLKGSCSGIDGPLLELLGNGLFLIISGGYMFYYTPSDLGHLTSFGVMPHYVIGGVILAYTLKILAKAKKNWALPIALYSAGLGFVISG